MLIALMLKNAFLNNEIMASERRKIFFNLMQIAIKSLYWKIFYEKFIGCSIYNNKLKRLEFCLHYPENKFIIFIS